MARNSIIKLLSSIFLLTYPVYIVFGQPVSTPQYRSQEVSEKDGIPVLIKHLPNWESVRDRITFARDTGSLKVALGARPIVDLIDFSAGTEAVTAPYDAGKLLIIEYATPQASLEDDAKFTGKLAEKSESGLTFYRRIGNYNVFVFDVADQSSANALLDQVKYEKTVTWLGKDPNWIQKAERAFVVSTSNLFLSTVLVILMGIGLSIVGGVLSGLVFFRIRERKRAGMTTFSDAGGMIRLNLDGLTPDILSKNLLGE